MGGEVLHEEYAIIACSNSLLFPLAEEFPKVNRGTGMTMGLIMRPQHAHDLLCYKNDASGTFLLESSLESFMEQRSEISLISERKRYIAAFHLSARNGLVEDLLSMLSKCGENHLSPEDLVRSTSGDCRTPLHYAVERGHVECTRVLLEYGSDPKVMIGHQPQPIHLACLHGKLDIVKLMVEKCGESVLQSCDQQGRTTLHCSTTSICSKSLISYLVEKGISVNKVDSNGCTPLSNAIQHGSVDTVEGLLQHGGDPLVKDKKGYTALHRAVTSKRIETFKKILNTNSANLMAATADICGHYPIHHALKLGLHEIVVALLAVTSEVFYDPDGNNYLHLAAEYCEEQTFTHLLSMSFAQYMINEINSSGCTPLHCAATSSNLNLMKKLLDHGAVIHKDNNGCTPFMCACLNGNLAAVKLLYSENEYQRDWVDHNGQSALHLAVEGRSTDVITFCLDKDMAIVVDEDKLTFFDKILLLNDRKMARVVLNHNRWEECIDACSTEKTHPILRILDQMPDIYKIILDQCYTKCSLDPSHPDYWEDFNFKCLDFTLEDRNDVAKTLRKQHTTEEGRNRTVRKKKSNKYVDSFTVVDKLIEHQREAYMRHPLVMEFIRLKWKGLGLQFRVAAILIPLLLALIFSVTIVILPTPSQGVSPLVNHVGAENHTFDSETNGTTEAPTNAAGRGNISMEIQVLLYVSLVIAILDLFLSFLGAYIEGLKLFLHITLSINVWTNFIASSSVIIYIVSALSVGLPDALWGAAAIGVLFAWFSVGFNLQFIHFLNLGIYVTMIVSTLKLVIIVGSSLFLFILGFAFAFNIVLGSVPGLQYNTIGLSLFTILQSLIATTDYTGITEVQQSDALRFPAAVFTLLVLLIILLPIVFINLLIGLAIGDINRILIEATFRHQILEVHAISGVHRRLVPHCWAKKRFKQHHRIYPNKHGWGTYIYNFFHKSQGASDVFGNERDHYDMLLEKFAEHKDLQRELYVMLDSRIGHLLRREALKENKLEDTIDAKIRHLEALLSTK